MKKETVKNKMRHKKILEIRNGSIKGTMILKMSNKKKNLGKRLLRIKLDIMMKQMNKNIMMIIENLV